MQTEKNNDRSVDLLDYCACRVDSVTDVLADACNSPGTSNPVRLYWEQDSTGKTVLFAFKPKYSYEDTAVKNLGLIPAQNNWHTFNSALDSDCSESLEILLEETLWQGRLVRDSFADYWLPLTLSDDNYTHLLQLVQQEEAGARFLEERKREGKPPRQHNLQKPVFDLLKHFDASDSTQAYSWEGKPIAIIGDDKALGIKHSTVLNNTVSLWFMPDNVALLQWRIEAMVTPEISSRSDMSLSSLLSNPLTQLEGYFGHWLRLHQSFRWLRTGYTRQKQEGKLLDNAEQTLVRMIWQKAAETDNTGDPDPDHKPAIGNETGKVIYHHLQEYLNNHGDPRTYSSAHVCLQANCTSHGVNPALQRAMAHLAPMDLPSDIINNHTNNFPAAANFTENWMHERTYQRWEDTGVQFAYTDFSACSIGTSHYYFTKILPEDQKNVYTKLTRLCLYQNAILRRFGRQLSKQPDLNNQELMLAHLETVRRNYQIFCRHGWFHQISDQVQPEEMYQLQARSLGIPALQAALRDEMTDAGAWLDLGQSQLEHQRQKKQDNKNRLQDLILALIALTIGLPTFTEMWRKTEDAPGFVQPAMRMLCDSTFYISIIVITLMVAIWWFINKRRHANDKGDN